MHQVAVLPPIETLGPVDAFRRLHDPAFHCLPPHLPLLPPFEPADASTLSGFDAFTAGAPFRVSFGPAVCRGESVVLPVEEGAEELALLHGALAAALLGPLDTARLVAPALLVGHLSGASERELVRRSVAAGPQPAPFTVTSLALLLEDERGIWHAVRHRVLSRRRVV